MDRREAAGYLKEAEFLRIGRERGFLRAEKRRALADGRGDPSQAAIGRLASAMTTSVTVFTVTLSVALSFGWLSARMSLVLVLWALCSVLVGAGCLGFIALRSAVHGAGGRAHR